MFGCVILLAFAKIGNEFFSGLRSVSYASCFWMHLFHIMMHWLFIYTRYPDDTRWIYLQCLALYKNHKHFTGCMGLILLLGIHLDALQIALYWMYSLPWRLVLIVWQNQFLPAIIYEHVVCSDRNEVLWYLVLVRYGVAINRRNNFDTVLQHCFLIISDNLQLLVFRILAI
jgi:hypothetical protein